MIPDTRFDHTFFSRNRLTLKQQIDVDIILISAGSRMQKSGDQGYPYRVNSNFWYLCGLAIPDAIVVIAENGDYLILGERYDGAEQWEGSVNEDALRAVSGITEILQPKEGWKRLRSELTAAHTTGLPLPPPASIKGHFYTNPGARVLHQRVKRIVPKTQIVDVRNQLITMRSIKHPEEIDAIQAAIECTGAAIQKLAGSSFDFEYQAEASLGYSYKNDGANGHAFSPIVAAGKNAATIHYEENNQPVAGSDMLLVDTGAQIGMYGADLTRTLPPQDGFSKRQREVYHAVLAVYDDILTKIKPGISRRELEEQAAQTVANQLLTLGLIADAGDKQAVRRYFPHAVSHSLGIDTHDVFLPDTVLAEGMVLAIEPGIYIPEEGIAVRLEDNILVVNDGIRNLSGHWLPHRKLLN